MNEFENNFKNKTGINFNTFYKENKDPLVWYLTRWTKDMELAEDLAEDAFIQALKKIDTYQGEKSKVHTWVYTIAKNITKKNYSESQKMPTVSMEKTTNDENSSLKMFLPYDDGKIDKIRQQEFKKKADIIKDAIRNLPTKQEKYKTVLVLRELDRLSYKEISKHLGLNLSTVKSQIRKGREIITKKIESKIKYIDENGLF